MVKILKRPQAVIDLEDIWWYVAQNNLQDADRLLDRIQVKLMNLAEFPQMGMGQDDLKPSLRSFTVGNYLVFYFPLVDGIDVVRVLHGARDLETIFKSDGSWQD
jgi:toxin ParE1/3/4